MLYEEDKQKNNNLFSSDHWTPRVFFACVEVRFCKRTSQTLDQKKFFLLAIQIKILDYKFRFHFAEESSWLTCVLTKLTLIRIICIVELGFNDFNEVAHRVNKNSDKMQNEEINYFNVFINLSPLPLTTCCCCCLNKDFCRCDCYIYRVLRAYCLEAVYVNTPHISNVGLC